jgi:hypothetical protein
MFVCLFVDPEITSMTCIIIANGSRSVSEFRRCNLTAKHYFVNEVFGMKKRLRLFNFVPYFFHRKAPELKQRLAGKSIPFEKFSVSRCKDYFEKEQYLWLPALVSVVFGNDNSVFINI